MTRCLEPPPALVPLELNPPLVGREEELSLLDDMLVSAAAGQAQSALIDGEPGIGKTRLIDELCDLASSRDFVVIKSAGEAGQRDRPYGVFDRYMATSRSHAAATTDWRRALKCLSAKVDSSPVLLILDDAHRADQESLHALTEFSREHASERLAFVLGHVPSAELWQTSAISETLADQTSVNIRLAGLAEEAMAELTAAVFGAPPGDDLLSRIAEVGGNPHFGISLLQSWHAERFLTVRDGRIELCRDGLPQRLGPLVLRTLRGLSPVAVHTLRVASVFGERFRVANLASVAAQSTAELLPALAEAIQVGVLDEDDDMLVFRNRLLRRAIYEDVPTAIRASLHLDAGLRLRESGSSLAEVGHHLLLGAVPGNPASIALLSDAARNAAHSAPSQAVGLLERALEVTPRTDPRRDMLLAELISASLWAGRVAEAERVSKEALAWSAHPVASAALRLARSMRGSLGKRSSSGVQPRPANGSEVENFTTRSMVQEAWGKLLACDLVGARRLAQSARLMGECAGDHLSVCAALGAEGLVHLASGRPRKALALAEKQVKRTTGAEAGAANLWPAHLFLAFALREFDRFDEAESALTIGAHRAEELGVVITQPFYQVELAELHFVTGNRDGAVRAAHSALATAGDTGTSVLEARAHVLLAEIFVHDNDLRASRRELSAAQSKIEDRGQWPLEYAFLRTSAVLAEAESGHQRALALSDKNWQMCLAAGALSHAIDLAPDIAWLCHSVGEQDRAVEIGQQLSEALAGSAIAAQPRSRCALLRCRAFGLDNPDLSRQAALLARSLPRPWLRARSFEQLGAHLAEHHSRAEGIELLRESLTLYQRLSAARDVARVKAALRRHGVRRRWPSTTPRQESTGHDSLTSAERDVLGLLAQGLSNRNVADQLFISPRTVETHVSHMFAKLGVSSRTELAVAANRISIPQQPSGEAGRED